MIEELRQEQGFSVGPMCGVLGVSKSGYYIWRVRKPSARKLEDERLKVAIKASHERGRGTYGPEKIQDELAEVEKVGYAMSHRMTQDLVGRALFRAVAVRRPPKGLIHHSDRGSQYLFTRPPETDEAVQDEIVDEPQRELLG